MMIDEEVFNVRPRTKRLNMLPENPEKEGDERAVKLGRFPSWLHRKLPKGGELFKTNSVLREKRLNTVCEEAKCPNRLECYSNRTATFLALGKACTRSCGFCDIDFAKNPKPIEEDEPDRIAQSVVDLGLEHVVITMVARDDIEDGGASAIAQIIRTVREKKPGVSIEVLTTDFLGREESIDIVLTEKPEVFNHNIETVRELSPRVRHKAKYDRTLGVLNYVKKSGKSMFVKSGIMVGLGENDDQVKETMRDLYQAGCDIVTIGHYLQANRHKLRVKSFVTPEQFKKYEEYGYELGIRYIYSGPFVRSSYNAGLITELAKNG